MGQPAEMTAVDAAMVCSTCHQNAHQQNALEGNAHTENNVNCSACHAIHGTQARGLLRAPEPALCLQCHRNVATAFARPYRHPVPDRVMRCSECHMAVDAERTELSQQGIRVCTDCHNELQGPFPFEHAATLEFSTEEGGCLACHEPHGSALPRLLKQPYAAPNFQLCSQCHVVPGHRQNAQHGNQWAGVACNTCHVDIHGSYVSRKFLTESLQAQGCFNSGCHEF